MRVSLSDRPPGQAAVEFAVSVLVFVLLMMGIMSFGLAVYAYNFCSYAARDATRYASVRGADSDSPATASDISTFVDNEAVGLKTANLTVNSTWSPNNKPGSDVQVQVEYTFNFPQPFTYLGPLNLTSTSKMIISQ